MTAVNNENRGDTGVDEKKAFQALKYRDEVALEWFIDRYASYVSTIVYNIIGQMMALPDVEEVTSDVFLAFWENSDRVKPDKIKAYLGGIARNKAKKKTRELRQDIPLEDDIIIISDTTPEHTMEQQERAQILNQAVLSMQHPEREIFLRHYYYYQPVAKIAEEMGINVSTVKTKLRRGRDKLRETLCKGGYDYGSEDLRPDGQYSRRYCET